MSDLCSQDLAANFQTLALALTDRTVNVPALGPHGAWEPFMLTPVGSVLWRRLLIREDGDG